MVCLGNICRSPMAQAIAERLACDAGLTHIKFDSAGTHASHLRERPDPRAQTLLAARGYRLGNIRSRRVTARDFQEFDLILAMDSHNLAHLRGLCPPEEKGKLKLFLEMIDSSTETEVPDPYYGNAEGFERVLSLCEAGAKGWIRHWSSTTQ